MCLPLGGASLVVVIVPCILKDILSISYPFSCMVEGIKCLQIIELQLTSLVSTVVYTAIIKIGPL